MASNSSKYTPVSQYDVDEGKPPYPDSPTDVDESLRLRGKPEGMMNTWEFVTLGVLFLLSAVFFTLWITSANAHKCTYVAKYSPANEAIEYIERVKYKGSLHFATPWRGDESGDPSPDIDVAWHRISTDVKPIRVTEEQFLNMGMLASPTTVKIPDEQGGEYLVSLEVTHHLACLDMLRKATYREYYESFYLPFQVGDETLTNQLDTCVELLRQALMCYPDINMVPYYWVHGRKDPVPDSNTVHRCKNFDKILSWATMRGVDVPHISSSQKSEKTAKESGPTTVM